MSTRLGTAQWDAVSSGNGGKRNPGTRVYYREDFSSLPRPSSAILPTAANSLAANPNLVVSGLSVVGGTAAVFDSNGGIALVAKSASSRRTFLKPGTKSNRTAWNSIKFLTDDSPCFSTLVKTGSAITTVQYFMGFCLTYARDVLTGTPNTVTDDDQVLFAFDTSKSATNLYVSSSIGGTDTLTDTGIDLATDTSYLLQISIVSSRQAHCYVNGTLVYATAPLTSAVAFKPRVEIINRTASATRKLMCRYIEVSKNAN